MELRNTDVQGDAVVFTVRRAYFLIYVFEVSPWKMEFSLTYDEKERHLVEKIS